MFCYSRGSKEYLYFSCRVRYANKHIGSYVKISWSNIEYMDRSKVSTGLLEDQQAMHSVGSQSRSQPFHLPFLEEWHQLREGVYKFL